MKLARGFIASALAVGATLGLAGCNPPMPPEVLAALAESSYTCVAGEVSISLSQELSDASASLVDGLNSNCSDTQAQLSEHNAQVVVAVDPAAGAYLQTPYAVDYAVFAITSAEGASAAFSPATIQGIINGSITSWDDPAIVADNFGYAPMQGPLVFEPVAQANAVRALEIWFEHYAHKRLDVGGLEIKDRVTAADYQNLPNGSVVFMPGSIMTELTMTAETLPVGAALIGDASANPEGVLPDSMSVQSAASQWKMNKSDNELLVTLDFTAKPTPPAGFDEAPAPYQVVYPLTLSLVGSDSLIARAAARYLLRQDSQSSFTLVSGLPESIRAQSLALVSKGLPEPEYTEPPTN